MEKKSSIEASRKPNLIEMFILFLFGFSLAVDMLSGYLVGIGIANISMIYKIALLCICIFYLMKKRCQAELVFSIFFLIILFLMHLVTIKKLEAVFSGFIFALKFFSIYVFYLTFKQFLRKGYIEYLLKVAVYSFSILCVNIVIGVFGFGYPMYGVGENAIGTSGFIFAGNELGVAFTASSALVLTLCLIKNNYAAFYTLGTGMLILSAVMTLKVPILSILIMIILFPLLKFADEINGVMIRRKTVFGSGFMLVIVPALLVSSLFYIFAYSGLLDRIEYLYKKLDLIGMLVSGRNIWLIEGLEMFLKDYSFSQHLFGYGNSWVDNMGEEKIIEIDFADFLLSYGIFGLTCLILFSFGCVLNALKILNKNPFAPYMCCTQLLLISISLFAGHVFWSGTAGYLVALSFALGGSAITRAPYQVYLKGS